MLHILHKSIKEDKPNILKEFKTGSWVILEEPTEVEIQTATTMLGLDVDLMQDARDPYEVPRIEKENGITYVFTRIPEEDKKGKEIVTIPIMLVIGRNFVLMFFQRKSDFVKNTLMGNFQFNTTQKAKLVFQVFAQINKMYSTFLREINKKVRSATVDFRKIRNNDIIRFVQFEATINDFMAALVPTNILLKDLLAGKFITLYETDEDLIEDIMLSNGQLIETCRANLKNIVNIRDSYSTIMTNNLNRVIRLLTALTVILTIPTIVASLFGMNVALPFIGNPDAFWIILGIVVVLSGLTLFIFSRNRWF